MAPPAAATHKSADDNQTGMATDVRVTPPGAAPDGMHANKDISGPVTNGTGQSR